MSEIHQKYYYFILTSKFSQLRIFNKKNKNDKNYKQKKFFQRLYIIKLLIEKFNRVKILQNSNAQFRIQFMILEKLQIKSH
ncbi:unnamed protein product [Paramecium sonneborni]|uniref:Uncharacterized protein n=1 Tax=Paramecium sonneborni TaxID=65129 RepID=A0A8S1QIC1_9CILI|nr:unnamed protein product [Paramecium sonneborni]